jgi:DNA helicase IV
LIEDRITDPDFKSEAEFDYLVLDEAQDILARPQLWRCIVHFLRGGTEKGAMTLFGDFDCQVLAHKENMEESLSKLRTSHPAQWRLDENCRNYRIVGETAVKLSGIQGKVYSGYKRSGDSADNFDIYVYDDDQAQLEKIMQWLRDAKSQGFRAEEITLLSFRSDPASAASRLVATGHKLRPAWQKGRSSSFASVHAFKGRENKIIILTDVVLEDRDRARQMFYTGMTRATESVRIACAKVSEGILLEWLSAGGADE